MTYLTHEPIDRVAWQRRAPGGRDGASVEFLGIVRGTEADQPIASLTYEAYEPMAERLIGELIEEATTRWGLHAVLARHRLGMVAVGEVAVLIDVRAAHRHEAFEACRWIIDAIKRDVPIWKAVVTLDGQRLQPTCADRHATR